MLDDRSPSADDRSSPAKAMAWVTKITTVSMMMVLPALAGYYLDTWLGTVVLFMFLGAAFGVVAGVWQLVKMIQYQEVGNQREGKQ